MPALHIRLLGGFQIDAGGTPLADVASPRLQSLLAYLLLHRGMPQARAHVAFQFWPDSSEAQAQANLRYFLHQVRRVLPDAAQYIQADKTTLQWLAAAPCTLDVAEFEHALVEADKVTPAEQALVLERAIAQYSGDLLPSCYDDWILPERERLRDLFAQALDRLSVVLEQRGDYAAAISYRQRSLQNDPLREATYRQLMCLLMLNGDRAGALRVYRTCVAVLKRELEVDPAPATREIYERLMQAEPPVSPPSAGRMALTPASRHNLPVQLTSFVGREREIPEVRRLLARTRLLTITGAGGSGKTRLALAVAAESAVAQVYADGICWVDLSAVSDPALVPQAVAAALAVHEKPQQPLGETLADHLRARRFLLLLDNCEHLVDACVQLIGTLLRDCPNLAVLATGRTGLGIAGEQTWLVPPLSLPPEHSEQPGREPASQVMQSEAVRLFVERAAVALPTFHLTEQNAPAVAQVCRRLDGVPLAVELAAARVRLLSVEQIAARLGDALRLLRGSGRSGPPRHQTLQTTIDWSYNLLTNEERALFRRLSVFAGGFTLEAVEAVCSNDDREQPDSTLVHQDDVLDLLSRLLDQSLLMPIEREQGAQARYRLLETIRQYSGEKLLRSGEKADVRQRHARYFMHEAEQTAREFKGRDQVAWIERLERENPNFRATLDWSLESRNAEVGLRLAGALWRFWFARGYLREGREWLTRLLALAAGPSRTPEYAAAVHGAGVIAWRQGDFAAARALGEAGLSAYHALEDGEGIGLSLVALANATGAQGDYAAQRARLEESLALFRELGDKTGIATALNNLGELARFQGDFKRAMPHYVESLALYQEMGNVNGSALVLHNLAHVYLHAGDPRRAASFFRDSLEKYVALGHQGGTTMCLAAAAGIAASQGEPALAVRLSGAAESARQAVGVTMDGADLLAHDRYLADARGRLSAEAFASAWAEGRALSLDQAVAYAFGALRGASAEAATLSP